MVEHKHNDAHTGKHAAINESALTGKKGQSQRVKQLSKADSRGLPHGSGKSDLRGELKKCEGKSAQELGI